MHSYALSFLLPHEPSQLFVLATLTLLKCIPLQLGGKHGLPRGVIGPLLSVLFRELPSEVKSQVSKYA